MIALCVASLYDCVVCAGVLNASVLIGGCAFAYAR
jgi:hypothetical protein